MGAGHLQEKGWPIRSYTLKDTVSPSPQLPQLWKVLSVEVGTCEHPPISVLPTSQPPSMQEYWLAWSCADELWVHESGGSPYSEDTILPGLCTWGSCSLSPCPSSSIVWALQRRGMINMSHYGSALQKHAFSALWPVISFFIKYSPFHKETSLMRSRR